MTDNVVQRESMKNTKLIIHLRHRSVRNCWIQHCPQTWNTRCGAVAGQLLKSTRHTWNLQRFTHYRSLTRISVWVNLFQKRNGGCPQLLLANKFGCCKFISEPVLPPFQTVSNSSVILVDYITEKVQCQNPMQWSATKIGTNAKTLLSFFRVHRYIDYCGNVQVFNSKSSAWCLSACIPMFSKCIQLNVSQFSNELLSSRITCVDWITCSVECGFEVLTCCDVLDSPGDLKASAIFDYAYM